MMIELWSLGRENNQLVEPAIMEYSKRINRYNPFKLSTLDNSKLNKNLPKAQLLNKEMQIVLQKLSERDLLVTLDEKGQHFTSTQFAAKLNSIMNLSPQRIIFLIGGSYGLSPQIQQKAILTLSLSALTFPHQMVRLVFTEQLYRAFSILKNEKYHHE